MATMRASLSAPKTASVTALVTHFENGSRATVAAQRSTPRFDRTQPRAIVTTSPAFVLIASTVIDADRLTIVLRGEHEGDLASAKRHAVTLLLGVAERFQAPACVDIQDHAGHPVFFVSTEVRP